MRCLQVRAPTPRIDRRGRSSEARRRQRRARRPARSSSERPLDRRSAERSALNEIARPKSSTISRRNDSPPRRRRWCRLLPVEHSSLLPPGCHEPRKQRGAEETRRNIVGAQVAVVIAASRDCCLSRSARSRFDPPYLHHLNGRESGRFCFRLRRSAHSLPKTVGYPLGRGPIEQAEGFVNHFRREVGVPHRHLDRRVPEQLLHGFERGPSHHEV